MNRPDDTEPNCWIGKRYSECGRVLIMFESHYGDPTDVSQDRDIRYFIDTGDDATFTRLHDACAPATSRKDFCSRFASMNFCDFSVGPTSSDRPTPAHLRQAASTLHGRLQMLRPGFVWLASKHSKPRAQPVLEAAGAPFLITSHPSPRNRHNISDAELLAAWRRCFPTSRAT